MNRVEIRWTAAMRSVTLEGRVEVRDRDGLCEVLLRHPTATDFEHDSLILSVHTLLSLTFSYARLADVSGVVAFDAYLVGIADWGEVDPLEGATPCKEPQCVEPGEEHLITAKERYYPREQRWIEPTKVVVYLILEEESDGD